VNFDGKIFCPSSVAEGAPNLESLQARATGVPEERFVLWGGVRWGEKDAEGNSLDLTARGITSGYSLEELKKIWPESQIWTLDDLPPNLDQWSEAHGISHIDLLLLQSSNTSDLDKLKNSKSILHNIKAIFLNHFQLNRSSIKFPQNNFLHWSGLSYLTHWPTDNLNSAVIYINNDYYYNSETKKFLENNYMSNDKYRLIYQGNYNHYYYIDEDPNDSIKTVLNTREGYEWVQSVFMEQLIRPNSLALDVGSHIGFHAITMSRRVGPSGAVIAFEPNNKLYMENLYNLQLNHCDNVISICKALGDTTKKAVMKKIKIEEEETEGETVDIIPLDSLNLNNVSCIKIDVENYEYFVLKGAKETILRNRPAIIFECFINCDFDDITQENQKINFDRVMLLLQSYNYEIFALYNCDFIALPIEDHEWCSPFKNRLIRLDVSHYDPKMWNSTIIGKLNYIPRI